MVAPLWEWPLLELGLMLQKTIPELIWKLSGTFLFPDLRTGFYQERIRMS